MTDIAYAIGDFFQWTFGILEVLGNIPNVIFILIGFGGIVYWLMQQKKYNREGKKAGTLL